MKLWLDDIRTPPDYKWLWAKTADKCIELLVEHVISHLSLDHDLADEHYEGKPGKEKTGYDVILWLEQNPQFVPPYINLHTMNPIGYERMRAGCEKLGVKATKFWKEQLIEGKE